MVKGFKNYLTQMAKLTKNIDQFMTTYAQKYNDAPFLRNFSDSNFVSADIFMTSNDGVGRHISTKSVKELLEFMEKEVGAHIKRDTGSSDFAYDWKISNTPNITFAATFRNGNLQLYGLMIKR